MDLLAGDTRGSIAKHCCLSKTFTLDELEGEGNASLDGRAWHRGIKWGCVGVGCIPFRGYMPLKVLDGEGNPVQPAYDEFIQYMGDVPIWTWAGTRNSA